jgi:hypothetical protein
MEIIFILDNAKVTGSVPRLKSKQEERERKKLSPYQDKDHTNILS